MSSYLTTPVGNNSLSYHERKNLGSDTRLRLPDIQTITSIDDVQLGSEIVFEEIDNTGKIQSLTGLAALYHMSPPVKPYLPAGRGEDPLSGREFWIMDNHNYALYARYVEAMKRKSDKAANKRFNDSTFRHFDAPTVLHIDAHADLDQPLQDLSPLLKGDPTQWEGDMQEKMRTYTTECTTVGSFIQPALESGLISDCIQIRSYYTLENLISSLSSTESSSSFILDIDLDFRAHEVFIPDHHLTIIQKIISSLASTSSLSSLTIATSPYFLDQHKAMKFLQQLKPVLQ